MAEKKFLEVFSRYKPTKEKRELIESAENTVIRFNREPMRFEVELSFSEHKDAYLIYEIEDDCRTLYDAESFKILPHFAPETFDISYFTEIAAEAALCGAVTNGFFSGAEYSDDGSVITVGIPYFMNGVNFVKSGNTEIMLSNILKSRYGINRSIVITEGTGAEARMRAIEERKADTIKRVEIENRERAFEEMRAQREREEQEAREKDPHYDFDKKDGISSATGVSRDISDTVFQRGSTIYSTEGAEVIYGEPFDIVEPSLISDAKSIKGQGIFLGTVFSAEVKESRSGDRVTVNIGISDGASGVYVKKSLPPEESGFMKGVKPGTNVAVFARPMRDKFDNELFLSLKSIMKIKRKYREDKSEKKRVELHLHTNMSQMDGLINPADLINTAIRWGHRAVAVTDHGNVQGFPEVMLALEKSGNADLKVLYGMEAYFVNDTARCIFGSRPGICPSQTATGRISRQNSNTP